MMADAAAEGRGGSVVDEEALSSVLAAGPRG
jgi:hypothetical protein